jgi:hypothetical protein
MIKIFLILMLGTHIYAIDKHKNCNQHIIVSGLASPSLTDPDGYLSIRSGPGGKYKLLKKVVNGSRVKGCGVKGNWVKIIYDCVESGGEDDTLKKCKNGWAYKKYLSEIDNWNKQKKKLPSNTFVFSQEKSSSSKAKQIKIPSAKVIITTGYGIDKGTALKDAFRSAVEQYVGVLVDADTIVKNDELIKDEILTASNGYIQSYDEVSVKNSDGIIEVKIKALVESQKVFGKIKSLNITTVGIEGGKGVYSRIVSKQIAKYDVEKILAKAFKRLFNKDTMKELLIVGIKDIKINEKGLHNGKVPVSITYTIKINKKVYEQKVKQLEQTCKGLGAKFTKGVDYLKYWNDSGNAGSLSGQNSSALSKKDLGIIRHYGKRYRLDRWRFPNNINIRGLTQSKELDSIKYGFRLDNYYNIVLTFFNHNDEEILSEFLNKLYAYRFSSMNQSVLLWGSQYPKRYENGERVKFILSPIYANDKNGNEAYFKVILNLALDEIKDLGNAKIELVEK